MAPGPNFEARAREARYGALERARAASGPPPCWSATPGTTRPRPCCSTCSGAPASPGWPGSRPAGERSCAPSRRPPGGAGRGLRRARPAAAGRPMNADPAHRRVWLRREVIPALETGAGRDLRSVLARQAAIARADSDLLDELAADLLARAGGPPRVAAGRRGAGVHGRRPPGAGGRRVDGPAPGPGPPGGAGLVGPTPPPAAHVEAVLAVIRRRAAVDRAARRCRGQPVRRRRIALDIHGPRANKCQGPARPVARAVRRLWGRPERRRPARDGHRLRPRPRGLGRACRARPLARRALDGGGRRRPGRRPGRPPPGCARRAVRPLGL